ncbi:OadG family transporter subunit [Thalassotalea maritima]|uniref:OadG family transporter subunit n=1 Tax=Thalassotalea maritima TaxID=3242416 RepID=UPI003527DD95
MESLSDVFIEAGVLLLVGMCFVFAFLTVLIFAIQVLAKIGEHFPDTIPEPMRVQTSQPQGDKPSPHVIAAISAAIAQYRNKNN